VPTSAAVIGSSFLDSCGTRLPKRASRFPHISVHPHSHGECKRVDLASCGDLVNRLATEVSVASPSRPAPASCQNVSKASRRFVLVISAA
jgi:hypothetical protein